MGTFATKQPSKDASKRKPGTAKPKPVRRGRNVSSLSTGNVLLQRKPACACGGGCPRCQAERDLEKILPIQTKLKISQPGDKYEQEADRVAEQIMRMPEPTVPESETTAQAGKETLQTKSASDHHATTSSLAVSPSIIAVQGSGQPLPQSERAFFEPRFGADFSQVRIHTDSCAAEMALSVNARAFTIGRDIVLGTGEYGTGSTKRRRFLAHELAHVMQQRRDVIQRQCRPTNRSTSPMEWAIQNAYLQENEEAAREYSLGWWRGQICYADIVDFETYPAKIYEIKENTPNNIREGGEALVHYIGAAYGNCSIELVRGNDYSRRIFQMTPNQPDQPGLRMTAEQGPPGLILWQLNRERQGGSCRENLWRNSTPIEILIQADYKLLYPQGLREYSIPNAGSGGGTGYADLVNMDNYEIYEIKPANDPDEIMAGDNALDRYVAHASECDDSVNWRKGMRYGMRIFDPENSGINPALYSSIYIPGVRIEAYQEGSHPGLILYQVFPQTRRRRSPEGELPESIPTQPEVRPSARPVAQPGTQPIEETRPEDIGPIPFIYLVVRAALRTIARPVAQQATGTVVEAVAPAATRAVAETLGPASRRVGSAASKGAGPAAVVIYLAIFAGAVALGARPQSAFGEQRRPGMSPEEALIEGLRREGVEVSDRLDSFIRENPDLVRQIQEANEREDFDETRRAAAEAFVQALEENADNLSREDLEFILTIVNERAASESEPLRRSRTDMNQRLERIRQGDIPISSTEEVGEMTEAEIEPSEEAVEEQARVELSAELRRRLSEQPLILQFIQRLEASQAELRGVQVTESLVSQILTRLEGRDPVEIETLLRNVRLEEAGDEQGVVRSIDNAIQAAIFSRAAARLTERIRASREGPPSEGQFRTTTPLLEPQGINDSRYPIDTFFVVNMGRDRLYSGMVRIVIEGRTPDRDRGWLFTVHGQLYNSQDQRVETPFTHLLIVWSEGPSSRAPTPESTISQP